MCLWLMRQGLDPFDDFCDLGGAGIRSVAEEDLKMTVRIFCLSEGRRATEPTFAPSDASLKAMAAPIPRAAPVTIAFFPSRGKPAALLLLDLVMVEDLFCLYCLWCRIRRIRSRGMYADVLWKRVFKQYHSWLGLAEASP